MQNFPVWNSSLNWSWKLYNLNFNSCHRCPTCKTQPIISSLTTVYQFELLICFEFKIIQRFSQLFLDHMADFSSRPLCSVPTKLSLDSVVFSPVAFHNLKAITNSLHKKFVWWDFLKKTIKLCCMNSKINLEDLFIITVNEEENK